jgi:ABC-2 type transport system permease protein
VNKYQAAFGIGVGVSMEHRVDFFMNILSTVFPIVIQVVFSGGVFPVDIFGPVVKGALDYLPFIYTIGFPISVATGNLLPGAILSGLFTQCFWILTLYALSRPL